MTDYITIDDPLYPASLKELFDPPGRLFYRGNLDVLRKPCLALVGTRDATPYGKQVAFSYAKQLASRGACVVSGLAFGIDAQAHRGALAGAGATVAVVAQSLEELQPVSHRGLAEEIVQKGGLLLSESAPGKPFFKTDYLVRNRLIAGLCSVTVVVEAGVRSGALNTAKHAVEAGREVLCVPGRIGDVRSLGCLQAIHEGRAGVALSETQIADLLELPSESIGLIPSFNGMEEVLYFTLQKSPLDLGHLAERFPQHLDQLYSSLANLESKGLIHATPQGLYCVVPFDSKKCRPRVPLH